MLFLFFFLGSRPLFCTAVKHEQEMFLLNKPLHLSDLLQLNFSPGLNQVKLYMADSSAHPHEIQITSIRKRIPFFKHSDCLAVHPYFLVAVQQ